MSTQSLNFFSFSGRVKILHTTWIAFFISFVVWFSHTPLMLVIAETLNISKAEIKTILILNVALTTLILEGKKVLPNLHTGVNLKIKGSLIPV